MIYRKLSEGATGGEVVLRVEIMVPSSQVGRIIGKGGQTVRQLQQMTRATIKLPEEGQTTQDEETPVHLIGDFFSTQSAQRQIRALVSRIGQAPPPRPRPRPKPSPQGNGHETTEGEEGQGSEGGHESPRHSAEGEDSQGSEEGSNEATGEGQAQSQESNHNHEPGEHDSGTETSTGTSPAPKVSGDEAQQQESSASEQGSPEKSKPTETAATTVTTAQ